MVFRQYGAHLRKRSKLSLIIQLCLEVITNVAVNTAWYLDRNGAHLRQQKNITDHTAL